MSTNPSLTFEPITGTSFRRICTRVGGDDSQGGGDPEGVAGEGGRASRH